MSRRSGHPPKKDPAAPKGFWAILRSLSRTVWLVGFISLLNDAASDMVYPLVPLYLATVLMAGPSALGLIEGVADATSSLLKLVSGIINDRTRRSKGMILLGYTLAGMARPLMVLATGWGGIMALRFMDRLGKGLRSSPRDALLAASVSETNRGIAYGLHRAMDNTGAVIGPLAAAGLLALSVPIETIFLLTIIPAMAAIALAGFITEPKGYAPPPRAAVDWSLSSMPKRFRRFLVVLGVFTLGKSSTMFLLLRASELGVTQAQIPLLWAGVSAVAVVFGTPLSALSDRIGRTPVLIGGWILFVVIYLALAVNGDGPVLIALFLGYGLFMAANEGVERALIADMAPPERRGTAFGWYNLISSFALLPASFLFGVIYEDLGHAAAFSLSAGLGLVSLLLFWLWVLRTRD